MADKKKSGNSKKNSASSKSAKAKAASRKKKELDIERDEAKAPAKEKVKKEHPILVSSIPYILMILGLVLSICLIARLFDMEDGIGFVGNALQNFLCGLFGPAAFLVPVALIYIGVKWCIYNIKKKEIKKGDSDYDELLANKKRYILQTVMASLLVVFVASLVGVFSGIEDFDFVQMWDDAAEDMLGGGVIGGAIAALMVMAFDVVISSIIVIILLAFIVIFMVGLTPDRIIVYIRNSSQARREERLAAIAEEEALEEERRREEQKHNSRLKAEAARREDAEESAKTRGASKVGMTVDQIMEDGEETESSESEVYIGPSEEYAANTDASAASQEQEEAVGEDYGGDPVFDEGEYTGISGVLQNLKAQVISEDNAAEKPENENINMGHIENEELLSDMAAVAPDDELDEEPVEIETPYVFPPMDMLEKNKNTQQTDFTQELQENARILMETLKSFKVSIREITYSRGPTITRYELKPEAGTRVRAIANLVDDIALNLATSGVRIEAPIPNKPAVGIEVPNRERATVYLRDLIESPKFTDAKSKLTSSLGMDVGGNPIYFDIAKMPHLLIAGATGMGKSVCINSIIVSILYKAKPDEVKLILVDPKKVEFNIYKDIPHLYAPIVSDPKKAAGALASAVAEMERRFELIEEVGVRDIATYNSVTENDPTKEFMPQMVIIIDELADLMMTAPDEVEASICRLAQKARAAGIHIIIGTQRPSVDVITGLIKANIPSRIACTVASQIDSRTILDMAGAEKLIGRGDMLFAPVGASKPMRVQGAFVSEAEVERIVTFIKENNNKAKYNSDFINRIEEEAAKCGMKKGGGASVPDSDGDEVEGGDSKFNDAVKLAIEEGKISTSLMQRRLGVGYGRAAKIIDTMEQYGYVSKQEGNKPRRVLITMDEYLNRVKSNSLGEEG
ncbi:MAG: DNA translocase FtsK [Clostridia bacterium]|nr:DNA translocase FtsK [Clostridia bacterium]